MTAWITQHFFHPGMVVPWGAVLIASPILIHLINRMRFRRVRFAAMEFLLQSQEHNRRRLLLEQLLLLALRVLVVLALVALLARLIIDPAQLSLFRGAKAHHLVLLDDSNSMRNRWSGTTAFDEGLDVIKKLVAQGARLPDTQRFTLLLLSEPGRPVFVERLLNESFVNEVETKLENLRCSHRALDLASGLDAAREILAEDDAAIKQLHVVSDFRSVDWDAHRSNPESVRLLADAGIEINFVRTVPERHENLAVAEFTGDLQVATAGVPLRLELAVKNFGQAVADDVAVSVFVDGTRLPMSIRLEKIEAGDQVSKEFDVTIEKPGKHRLRVELDGDPLEEDNTRYLAVNVADSVPVLIIGGDPAGAEAEYVVDALAADPSLTGLSPVVGDVDDLSRQSLDPYSCIYLLNVPELSAEAREALSDYVRDGGGLAWFLGDAIKPAFYNQLVSADSAGLFPVPLASAPRELAHDDATLPGPDLRLAEHPLFRVFEGQDNPFIESVRIDRYFAPADGWNRDDQLRKDGVSTLAVLRNNDPVLFEHRYGRGRVLTALTSAGPVWNAWARNPSYVVYQLELQKYVARQDRALERRVVGDAIRLSLNPAEYLDSVEITAPDAGGQRLTRLKAARQTPGGERDAAATAAATAAAERDAVRLVVDFGETDAPGIYSVTIYDQSQTALESLIAYNVSVEESALELASDADIRGSIGDGVRIQIQQPGSLHWLQGRHAGEEVRKLVLLLLFGALLAEQWLAYRMSYHPSPAGAPA